MLQEVLTGIRGSTFPNSCMASTLAFLLAVGPTSAGASGPPPMIPEGAISGTSLIPNAERLQVNTSSATRTVVALTRDEALMQIRGLADKSMVEEQWAFLPDHGLWIELGVNESADGVGSQVEIDRELLAALIADFGRIDLYHFHPRYYFEQLAGEIDFSLALPAAYLPPEQLEAVGLALPSPADVHASIEVALLAESIDPFAEIRHAVVSAYGMVSYGPTQPGQRKLARERGYPLGSLQRELEVASALHRSTFGVASVAQAQPGLSVRDLLVELCGQMSSKMYFMSFEPHGTSH